MKRSGRDPEAVAAAAFERLAADPERLGGFLAASGLHPGLVRRAAAEPGFLAAILDHVAADEALLLAVAAELDMPPEELAAAQVRLSPRYGDDP